MLIRHLFTWAFCLGSAAIAAQSADWTVERDAMVPFALTDNRFEIADGVGDTVVVAGSEMLGTLGSGWGNTTAFPSPAVRRIESGNESIIPTPNGLLAARDGGGFAVMNLNDGESFEPNVIRFDQIGRVAWSRSLPRVGALRNTRMTLSPDGSILAALSGGVLYALDAASGAVNWSRVTIGSYSATFARNIVPPFAAMDDGSIWTQRGAYGQLIRQIGSSRRIFDGPAVTATPYIRACGIVPADDGWIQLLTTIDTLIVARHSASGELLGAFTAPLMKSPSPCAGFLIGDRVLVHATDLFTIDAQLGTILSRRALPELPEIFDIAAFGDSLLLLGRSETSVRIVEIQSNGTVRILAAPHGAEGRYSRGANLVVRSSDFIVLTLATDLPNYPSPDEIPVLSRYSLAPNLALDPQPIRQLVARRQAQIGSVQSSDDTTQYFAWSDWANGANQVVVEKRHAQSGALMWTHRFPIVSNDLAQRALSAAPTLRLSKSRLLITTVADYTPSNVVAAFGIMSLDSETGTLIAQREWGPTALDPLGVSLSGIRVDSLGQPYVAVFRVSARDEVLALSADLKSTRWARSARPTLMIVSGNRLLLGGFSESPGVQALALDSGQTLWSAALNPITMLALPDDRLAVSTRTTAPPYAVIVTTLNQETGKVIWNQTITLANTESGALAVLATGADNSLYAAGSKGPRPPLGSFNYAPFVAKFDGTTGQLVWQFEGSIEDNTAFRISQLVQGKNNEIWARGSRTVQTREGGKLIWKNSRTSLIRLRESDGAVSGWQLLSVASPSLGAQSSETIQFVATRPDTWWLRDTFRRRFESRGVRWRALSAPQFRPNPLRVDASPGAISVYENQRFETAFTVSNAAPERVSATVSISAPSWASLVQPSTEQLEVTLDAGEQRVLNLVLLAHGPLTCTDPTEVTIDTVTATVLPTMRETHADPNLPRASVSIIGKSDRLFSDSLEAIEPPKC